ncbi:cupin domain-containing protein [Pseudonocardia acidicola]|uniref:Cupin domain-containing protein n=1 Tax=Pseudonocardia acidicola TaxID=2724939 RepID=A0ABX1S427_9PSEU|nr:cupin domain-containing protein [Pseudonocardia acidicola]NMH96281.1 hypothetical protein [Pseudonocardia acidicola]
MAFNPRRIVTDRTSDGTSVFAEQTDLEPGTVMIMPGAELFNVWGTQDGIPVVGAGDNPPTVPFPFFPGPGGTRLVVVRFPPDSAGADSTAPNASPEEMMAEAEDKQPGLAHVFEPDNPGMHTTDSIDYGICVDGEIWLELDDGAEAHVTPGTFVVQRGTRHAWRNKTDRHCTMVYVLVGAKRTSG